MISHLMQPKLSVIIRTHNEAPRLKLTLASLAREQAFEVVVTNDGSNDETAKVLSNASHQLPLRVVHHEHALGRSAASNAAACAAQGDVLLFIDGDQLIGPGCIAAHTDAHARIPNLIGRGETRHLRSTRFFHDPETGSPQVGHEERMARMSKTELANMVVTKEHVLHDFESIARKSEAGIYPGVGPRKLYELEISALISNPNSPLLWMTASGSNMSVRRESFIEIGGFNPDIDLLEQREMAARLCAKGQRMGFVEGALTHHLCHRSGWRDPMLNMSWEHHLIKSCPGPATRLLPVLWASLADKSPLPVHDRIESLEALEQAALTLTEAEIERLRSLVFPGCPHTVAT